MAFPFTRRVPAGDVGDWPGALGNQTGLAGKRAIGVELSGQYEVSASEARRGLRGLLNVARHLGMMPGAKEGLDAPSFEMSDPPHPITVQTRQSGLFVEAPLHPIEKTRRRACLSPCLLSAFRACFSRMAAQAAEGPLHAIGGRLADRIGRATVPAHGIEGLPPARLLTCGLQRLSR